MDQDSPNAPAARPGPVRRLTFAYDGDRVHLVDEHHVEMIVPPTHPLDVEADTRRGFSVVLRDARDRPVYRFTRTSPMRHNTETFGTEAEPALQRHAIERPSGTFVVLVPDTPGARTLELVGHPLQPEAHQERPRSLTRVSLRAYGRE